mgnify:FL=1
MKIKLNIKNVLTLVITAVFITSISLFFMNTSLAANTAKVTVDTANLREKADSDSKILDLVNKGENVEIVDTIGEWYKVKYKNITGYIRKDLLQLNNETNNIVKEQNTIEENTQSQNIETENTIEESVVEANTTESTEITGKYKAKEDIKLKVIPLISSLDLQDIKQNTELEVKDTMNNWAYVTVQEKQGWVVLEKIEKVENKVESTKTSEEKPTESKQTEQQETEKKQEAEKKQETTVKQQASKTMYTNTQTVNLRSSADRTSTLITQIAINTKVEVVSESNGWSKVKVNGKEGYIASTLLSTTKQETSRGAEESRITAANKEKEAKKQETTQTETSKTSSNSGESVVSYAKQFIGTKYTYGGTSPSTGFDCSGFTSYVYKHFGVSLPRTSGGQSGVGTAVTKANLQVGDLVIYSGHVAIYLGGGNVIHSPRPGKSVCIVPLNQAASGFSGGRRILN